MLPFGDSARTRKSRQEVSARRRNLAILVALVAAFHVMTMPGSYYRGDNFAPRTEAVFFLTEGRLGIPQVPDQPRSGFLENRGQYFFENDQRREIFSKYGIINTLLYLPPLLAEMTIRDALPPMPVSATLLAFINIFNTIFFVVAMLYLYGLASLYSKKEWVRLTWVFITCFASFLWHYLRAPALEIYQIPVVLAAVFHALSFWRIRRVMRDEPPRRAWLNLAAASTAMAVAINLKTLFVLLLPLLVWFVLASGDKRLNTPIRIASNLCAHFKPLMLSLVLPMALGIALLLWSNWYRFGSIFETGYSQWVDEHGLGVDRFGPQFILPALRAFLFTPGNTNIWMHAPLLLIALFGWPLFWRRRSAEALFIALSVLILLLGVCSFSAWSSGWCYGPRYLVIPVALASIPLALALDRLHLLHARVRVAIVGVLAAMSGISLALNIAVNSLGYFAPIEVKGQFVNSDDAPIIQYLRTRRHDGHVSLDLLLHHWGVREFIPLKAAREIHGARSGKQVAALAKVIAREATPDWWFLKWARARRAGQNGFHTMPLPVKD